MGACDCIITKIFTRCQGDRCVVNRGEGLTAVDFGGGDAATAGAIGRSEGQREKRCDGVEKVPLLVGADATVVVHKEDDLVQKNASVEELRKQTDEPPSPTATSCASSAPAITAASACTSPSSWTVTRMECSGNDRLNAFLARRSVPRDADPAAKYNSRAAAAYRGRIQALAEGRPWQDPPVVKEATTKPSARKPPRSQSGRDRWGGDHLAASSNMRRNQSVGDLRRGSGRQGGAATEDLPTMAQKPANKESYFARKMDAVGGDSALTRRQVRGICIEPPHSAGQHGVLRRMTLHSVVSRVSVAVHRMTERV
ncbi:hypothetical protein BHE74_00023637 [Ensete ventricosum]|nr:hypothetical protein BHE74_00023637 [Ensete ventricosum]